MLQILILSRFEVVLRRFLTTSRLPVKSRQNAMYRTAIPALERFIGQGCLKLPFRRLPIAIHKRNAA